MDKTDALEKDVSVLKVTIANLSSEIVSKRKELSSVDNQIVLAYSKLKDISDREKPLIENLISRKESLEKEISSCEINFKAKCNELNELMSSQNLKIQDNDRLIAQQQIVLDNINLEIHEAQEKNKVLSHNNLLIQKEIDLRQFKINELLSEEERLNKLAFDNDSLQGRIDIQKQVLDSLKNEQEDIYKFRTSLEQKEKELEQRERMIDIMEHRLKPRYIKVFGKFNNLDN